VEEDDRVHILNPAGQLIFDLGAERRHLGNIAQDPPFRLQIVAYEIGHHHVELLRHVRIPPIRFISVRAISPDYS
jgi:hypothetical protein